MEVSTQKFQSRPLQTSDDRTLTLGMVVPDDSEALIDFLTALAGETTHTLQFPGRNYSQYAMQQRIARTSQSHGDLLLCVKDEGRVIAHLDFQTQNDQHPWVKHVARFGMAVLQAYEGVGIARALMAAMEEWAESIGVSRIEGLCRTDNERGLELYRGQGYALEGLRHNAAMIEGEFKDEYYLAKILEN